MRTTAALFLGGVISFIPVGLIYAYFSKGEPVGTVGLLLLGVMSGMFGFYLRAAARKLELSPSDNAGGDIADSAGDYGFYSPHSWWPLVLAFTALLLFLGLAVGWWLFVMGAVAGVLALVGWTFEYYRGDVL